MSDYISVLSDTPFPGSYEGEAHVGGQRKPIYVREVKTIEEVLAAVRSVGRLNVLGMVDGKRIRGLITNEEKA